MYPSKGCLLGFLIFLVPYYFAFLEEEFLLFFVSLLSSLLASEYWYCGKASALLFCFHYTREITELFQVLTYLLTLERLMWLIAAQCHVTKELQTPT